MKILIITPVNPTAICDASIIYKQFSNDDNFVFSPQLMAILAEQSLENDIKYVPYMLSILKCLDKEKWEEKNKKHTIFFGNKLKNKKDNFDCILYFNPPYIDYPKNENKKYDFDLYLEEVIKIIPDIGEFYTPDDATHKLPTIQKILLMLDTLGIKKAEAEQKE